MSSPRQDNGNLLDAYMQLLRAHPVKTKMLTSASISALSNLTNQLLLQRKYSNLRSVDLHSLIKFICAGFLSAFFSHHWFSLMDNVIM